MEEILKKYSQMNNTDLYEELNSSDEGISIVDLEEKLNKYGNLDQDLK